MNKKLIVNADDFGLTESINNGILESFCNGIVTRTSLIANASAFNQALKLSQENPALNVGIHLTLIEEKPVSSPMKIKSLIDTDGKFFKNCRVFLLKYIKRQISLSEIRIELEAQIKKAKDNGIKITHLDSHQHLHMIPGIFSIVKEIMGKFDIKNIRMPNFTLKKILNLKELSTGLLAKKCKASLLHSNISYPDRLWGLDQNGNINEMHFLKILKNLHPGVTEIICHPGFIDEEYIRKYSHWHYNPTGDLSVMTSSLIKETIKNNDIQLLY